MIQVKSKFENTAIAFANAGVALRTTQGSPVTLRAKNLHAAATHDWELGDGATAAGAVVTHTYAEPGFYVVKLVTVVNEDGGARTRHFVAVTVDNAPPEAEAGPALHVNEGEVVSVSGSFLDVGWLDTHTAAWAWGDDDPPTPAAVSEQNDPPRAIGTATATHAWGDAGTYTVTLSVRDDDGALGEDQTTVTVANVPPTVDAGPAMFAYPDTVITLRGSFTDPGWLNTHDGQWEFGDGAAAVAATIQEVHEPPAGTGSVIASHAYRELGCYNCTCTVTDDRGGVGVATKPVRVVDVRNPSFEDGFRGLLAGAVANEWEPYAATIADFQVQSRRIALAPGMFTAEELLVHGGQRCQRIRVDARTRGGVYQQIGANPNWEYQITTWYSLLETSDGMVRLGVDPAGGGDATAAGIVWTTGRALARWEQMAARVVAVGNRLTIFLEATGRYQLTRVEQKDIAVVGRPERDREDGADACFDRVRLLAVQPFCPPRSPARGASREVDRDPIDNEHD